MARHITPKPFRICMFPYSRLNETVGQRRNCPSKYYVVAFHIPSKKRSAVSERSRSSRLCSSNNDETLRLLSQLPCEDLFRVKERRLSIEGVSVPKSKAHTRIDDGFSDDAHI